jgi:type II secretory pathway pseudopilin PulG
MSQDQGSRIKDQGKQRPALAGLWRLARPSTPRLIPRGQALDPRRSTLAGGFTYVGLLVVVALIGVGLAVTGEAWRTTAQREKERELLFVGDQFRKAITQYYDGTPGGVKQFPNSFDDLLKDPRYPATRRHLRKVYRDPMTGKRDWGIVRGPGDSIMGVYSLARQMPMKQGNFPPEYVSFERAESYAAWRFQYSGSVATEATAPAPGVPQPATSLIPSSSVIGKPPLAPLESGGTVERK